MYAGRLDRFIDIQRYQQTQSPSGAPVTTWVNLATQQQASLMALTGSERYNAPQFAAAGQVEFRVRYAAAIAGLTPKDRIVYPAVTAPAQPSAAQIYNIIAVNELGRREGLRIVATRFADAS